MNYLKYVAEDKKMNIYKGLFIIILDESSRKKANVVEYTQTRLLLSSKYNTKVPRGWQSQ